MLKNVFSKRCSCRVLFCVANSRRCSERSLRCNVSSWRSIKMVTMTPAKAKAEIRAFTAPKLSPKSACGLSPCGTGKKAPAYQCERSISPMHSAMQTAMAATATSVVLFFLRMRVYCQMRPASERFHRLNSRTTMSSVTISAAGVASQMPATPSRPLCRATLARV